MRQLEAKHRAAFRAHPDRAADMLFHQAVRLWKAGVHRPAVELWATSVRADPSRALRSTGEAIGDRVRWSIERRRSGH
jgi:hypothetical protein